MPYTARTRNRYRLLVAGVTGLSACAAAATTGAIAAVAARSMAEEGAQQTKQAPGKLEPAKQASKRKVIWKQRPHRTIVTTRVVQSAGTPSVVQVGGGSLAPAPAPAPAPPSGGSGGSGSSGGSSGPGPAPSSGS